LCVVFSGIFSSIVIQGAEAKGGGGGGAAGDGFESHGGVATSRKGSAISSAKSTYSKSQSMGQFSNAIYIVRLAASLVIQTRSKSQNTAQTNNAEHYSRPLYVISYQAPGMCFLSKTKTALL